MSRLNVNNVAPASGGTETDLYRGLAKVWANLDGTGTVNLRDSLNVSSVTDNGTGDYTTHITNAMNAATYPVLLSHDSTGGLSRTRTVDSVTPRTVSLYRIYTLNYADSLLDCNISSQSVQGDLA